MATEAHWALVGTEPDSKPGSTAVPAAEALLLAPCVSPASLWQGVLGHSMGHFPWRQTERVEAVQIGDKKASAGLRVLSSTERSSAGSTGHWRESDRQHGQLQPFLILLNYLA